LELYELIEVKGKGAYGIVWKARDKKSNQIVALKKVFEFVHIF
jgi:mitogen-activated protein kinase 15